MRTYARDFDAGASFRAPPVSADVEETSCNFPSRGVYDRAIRRIEFRGELIETRPETRTSIEQPTLKRRSQLSTALVFASALFLPPAMALTVSKPESWPASVLCLLVVASIYLSLRVPLALKNR